MVAEWQPNPKRYPTGKAKENKMTKSVRIQETKAGKIVVEYRFTCDRASRSIYADRNDHEYDDVWYHVNFVLKTPEAGATYMVGTAEYVGPNGSKNPCIAYRDDNGEGWSGNSDSYIKRYHGWRGTTDDWAFFGMGVRVCEEVKQTGDRSMKVRVVFGRDLKKNED